MSCIYINIYIEDMCAYTQIFFHIWGFFHKYIFHSLFLFLFYVATTDYFTLLSRNKECCTLRIYEWVLLGEFRITIINFLRTSTLKRKSLSLLTETSVKKETICDCTKLKIFFFLVMLLYGSWLDLYYQKRLQPFLTSVLPAARSQLVFLKPRVIKCNGN